MIQNLKKKQFVISKLTRIWWISVWALKSLKNSPLIGLFHGKYITFELKKYRGVIFHDTEESCKIWRKTDLWFGKWHEEFGKFSPEHLKVSKLGLWWDLLIQSRKSMRLKFTEELFVMIMKLMQNRRNLLVVSKLTWEIWWSLTQALESPKLFNFNVLLLSNVYIVWGEKIWRSYLWWCRRVMQNLKKNCVVWKMTWGIWQIFTRALESVKIGTLMGSFCPK